MTLDRAIELLKIERECVSRNTNGCDRNCAACDLVQEDWELLEMYGRLIEWLEQIQRAANGDWISYLKGTQR